MTMRVISRLEDLANEAAAGTDLRRYLDQRGIKAVATLALLAASEAELDQKLVEPLLAGWKVSDTEIIRLPIDEHPIARAILLHMWMLARQSWQITLQTSAPSATPSATPPVTAPSTSTAAADKVPKTLPAGVWVSLVKAYNSIQLNGHLHPVRWT